MVWVRKMRLGFGEYDDEVEGEEGLREGCVGFFEKG